MSTTKKILSAIPLFILWIIYFSITLKQRNEYMMAEQKGMKCVGSKDTGWIISGTATTYTFDPNKKPEREYSTWKEFWKRFGY